MKVVNRKFLGRFGNQLFQYAFARAYCDKFGFELHTDPWVGEEIFQIQHPRIEDDLPRVPDTLLEFGESGIEIEGYSQLSRCMVYTEADACKWFAFRPDVEELLRENTVPTNCAHYRCGDYVAAPYPIISKEAFRRAWTAYGFADMDFVEEHSENVVPGLPEFLPDFYRLMVAPVMFRSNSTYSWWAGVLNAGQVFSPITTGLAYSIEHDMVPFVPGNYSRICDLHMVEELCLKKR